MSTLTALVHTKNSAATLAVCLRTLRFADEVIVIDMKSSDDTVEIAKKHSATVLEHKDVGYVEPARAFALKQVKTDWTLIVDADEEIPESLAIELKRLMKDESAKDAYYIPRKNIVFQKWIEHTGWWPDFQLRFFKTGKLNWPEQIHAQPVVEGSIGYLEEKEQFAILHHNYQTIEQFVDRLNRYTTIEVDRGQRSTDEQKKMGPAVLPSAFSQEFARRYFVHDGYLDGGHGLALSYLQSMYQVITELKRWQKAGFSEVKDADKLPEALEKSFRELNYWIANYKIQKSTGIHKFIWMIRRKLRW